MKTHNGQRPTVPAFTLVELLVLTAVLSILAAILLPVLSDAKANARTAFCMNNLKQWGVGFNLYANDWNDYFPAEGGASLAALGANVNSPDMQVWPNAIPPYLKMIPYRQFLGQESMIQPIDHLRIWVCPEKNMTANSRSVTEKNSVFYAMNGLLDGGNAGTLDGSLIIHVKRGVISSPDRTVLMFDTYANQCYGDPTEWVGLKQAPYPDLHQGGCNFLFVDGHVANFPTSAYFNGSNGITNYPGLKWTP